MSTNFQYEEKKLLFLQKDTETQWILPSLSCGQTTRIQTMFAYPTIFILSFELGNFMILKSVNYFKQQIVTHLHIHISHQSNHKWFIALETQWIYQYHYHISFFFLPFSILFCFSFLQLTNSYKKKKESKFGIFPLGKNNFKNAWIFYKWPNVSCSQIC